MGKRVKKVMMKDKQNIFTTVFMYIAAILSQRKCVNEETKHIRL